MSPKAWHTGSVMDGRRAQRWRHVERTSRTADTELLPLSRMPPDRLPHPSCQPSRSLDSPCLGVRMITQPGPDLLRIWKACREGRCNRLTVLVAERPYLNRDDHAPCHMRYHDGCMKWLDHRITAPRSSVHGAGAPCRCMIQSQDTAWCSHPAEGKRMQSLCAAGARRYGRKHA